MYHILLYVSAFLSTFSPYLLLNVSSGHNSITIHNRIHVYLTFWSQRPGNTYDKFHPLLVTAEARVQLNTTPPIKLLLLCA